MESVLEETREPEDLEVINFNHWDFFLYKSSDCRYFLSVYVDNQFLSQKIDIELKDSDIQKLYAQGAAYIYDKSRFIRQRKRYYREFEHLSDFDEYRAVKQANAIWRKKYQS